MIVPSTIVIPRDGSFALAFLGIVRVHDSVSSFALGRNNLAVKRIVDFVSCSLAMRRIYIETQSLHSLASPRLVVDTDGGGTATVRKGISVIGADFACWIIVSPFTVYVGKTKAKDDVLGG